MDCRDVVQALNSSDFLATDLLACGQLDGDEGAGMNGTSEGAPGKEATTYVVTLMFVGEFGAHSKVQLQIYLHTYTLHGDQSK